MNKYKTPKLFFSKYPYKLVFKTVFAHSFRGNDLIYIREMLDHYFLNLAEGLPMYVQRWREQIRVSPVEVAEAQRIYTALSKNKDYKIRVENEFITIYSKERNWLYELGELLNAYEWWEPATKLEPGIVVMGPKMTGWEYKITLGLNIPDSFYNWAITNESKLKIGNKLMLMLTNKQRGLSGYYFYVHNDKMLNLVSLVIGPGLQRVDKIVVDDWSA